MSERHGPTRGEIIAIGACLALTAFCIVTIDRPLARVLGGYEQSGFWSKSVEMLEWTLGLPFFKLFAPVVLVVAMVTAMAVPRFRFAAPPLMVIAGTHLICRFLTNRIKDATGRLRPSEWLAKGGDETFFRDGIAFPSGHVVLFASILIPLAIVYPRTRPLLAIVAFVSLARILVNAHYVSDALGSVTLAGLAALALASLVRPRVSRR
ncbi:MAG: phosphatase PAP2 family protein [Myxococcota bacterium]|nr:phosphatase PAP2 family protein [Myxococcota bacterium]